MQSVHVFSSTRSPSLSLYFHPRVVTRFIIRIWNFQMCKNIFSMRACVVSTFYRLENVMASARLSCVLANKIVKQLIGNENVPVECKIHFEICLIDNKCAKLIIYSIRSRARFEVTRIFHLNLIKLISPFFIPAESGYFLCPNLG